VATASTKGLDFKVMTDYARKVGNPNLRKMTFHQRGNMLKALALHLRNHLDKFYAISYKTGATKADSWVDIEGGIGNLFANASLRRKFPDEIFCIDGESHNLSKNNTFMGTHILVPKEGVAIHINAFNFPVWGMMEKIAVNLLAGMPAIVKPATITSFLTEAVVKEIIANKILPEGALQLICGSAGDLLDHVTSQDVVTFTGSASTGLLLKQNPKILQENVPFNMEADSLNCIVLGDDVTSNMPEWDLFIKEVRKEITVKDRRAGTIPLGPVAGDSIHASYAFPGGVQGHFTSQKGHGGRGSDFQVVLLEMVMGVYSSHLSGGRAMFPLKDRKHPLGFLS
jgi:oxepin-CoA hydrolase/3-oxo-5,6-dehydrosuberyl-CoA semialdehyde dehydrogenase